MRVDRDTYRLFELQPNVPTFAYDLEQAVKDGYLVPPKAVSVPLRFQREGIVYDDLPDEEKEKWDAIEWTEEGEVPNAVAAEAVNKWLFNMDTVDKVLAHLMQNGIKVAGGDRLGKTIIFAKNKDHARFIEKQFNMAYPSLKGTFARVIDHYEPYAQSILDDFSIAHKNPHIAISVDMLDTGIDVPEVVNLVFFKIVRSKTKFFQMIGRGTRLCKDLFAPGVHKTEFYIFDFCQNLEFFSQNPQGVDGSAQLSLGARLFKYRLELHSALEKTPEESITELRTQIADVLHKEVAAMNVENFLVRPKRREVEAFRERSVWDTLAPEQYDTAIHALPGLPSELPAEDETAKRFDAMILRTQLAIIKHYLGFERLRDQIREIASKLEEKRSIPMVEAQMTLILEVQSDEWWTNVTLPLLEGVRVRLRDLVRFIDKSSQKIVYTDFEDEIGTGQVVDLQGIAGLYDVTAYKRKMEQFIEQSRNHISINRLRMNEPLTPGDLQALETLLFKDSALGGREQFEKAYGKQESLGLFIRGLIGMDREAAKQAFGEYLTGSRLNGDQIRFVNFIVEYLTKSGVMEPERLYESPCTDISPQGLDGVFKDADAEKIISILNSVKANAGVEFGGTGT